MTHSVRSTPEDFAKAGAKLDAEAGLAEHVGIVAGRLELEAAYYADEGTLAVVETCREAAALLRDYRQVLLSERGEPSELQVQAGAVILATTPLINAPKLDHHAWMGLSRAILEAANAVRR
jgi:hypothetical protein